MRPAHDDSFPASSFRWTGPTAARPRIELVVGSPALRDQLEAFAARCSDETLFRRFHGGGRGSALTREIDRWTAPTPGYRTIAALLGGQVHGVGNLAVSRDGEAELAVLVEDEWRRRGVASRLLRRLTRLALEAGHEVAHVDIQPDNHAALTLLGSMASDYSRQFNDGTFTAEIPIDWAPASDAPTRTMG